MTSQQLGDVSLEGYIGRDENDKAIWQMVPAPDALAAITRDHLYGPWRSRILNAASEHLEDAA